jgi:hypothetical protein
LLSRSVPRSHRSVPTTTIRLTLVIPQRTDILPVCSPFDRKLYLDARSPAKSIVVSYSATGYHYSAHARHGMARLERYSDVSRELPSEYSAGTIRGALHYCSSTCLRIQVSWRTSYQSSHSLGLCHGNRPDFDVHVPLKVHRTLCRSLGYSRGVTCICTTLKSCFDRDQIKQIYWAHRMSSAFRLSRHPTTMSSSPPRY